MPYNEDGEWVMGDEVVDPRANAIIVGYGNRLARSTANGWVAPGGAEVSDEEASKIHSETISKRNESWAAEAEATRKSNIPDKPSDDALALAEARRKFMAVAAKHIDIDPEAEGQRMADATRAQMTGNIGDRVLKDPKEIHEINKIAEARGAQVRAEKERERQQELDKLSDIFAKKYAEEQEAKKYARNEAAKKEAAEKKAKELKGQRLVPNYDTGYMERYNSVTGEREVTDLPVKPTVEKEPLSVNIERVRKMYAEYIKDKTDEEIDPSYMVATKKAADTVGLELKKVSVPDPGWLPSTKNRTKDVWQLVPKDDAETVDEKQLDKATAQTILREAGGDKNKARQIAKQRGYKF